MLDVRQVLSQIVPDEIIATDPATLTRYERNITGLKRHFPGVVFPRDEAEVQALLTFANTQKIPLYPFSSGKNWGLGSRLPVQEDCLLVDLSRMNRIVEVNPDAGYAMIEPGVTQLQLIQHLKANYPQFLVNFTGSFAHTSIMGNTLDRGDGFLGLRINELLGVQGFCGDGTPFAVGGYGHYQEAGLPSHHYPFGTGPDMRSLFTQSNFGIVTRIVFALVPNPPAKYLFWASIPDAQLEQAVEAVETLCKLGVLPRTHVHLGYVHRAKIFADMVAGQPEHSTDVWNIAAIGLGTPRMAAGIMAELTEALAPLSLSTGSQDVSDASQLQAFREVIPERMYPMLNSLHGIPDRENIRSIYTATDAAVPEDEEQWNPDETSFGMKCYLPVVPTTGLAVRQAMQLVERVGKAHGFPIVLNMDFNGVGISSVYFDSRDEAHIAKAESCLNDLAEQMMTAGFPPHRLSIDQMVYMARIQPASQALAQKIKQALDPNGIIAPGRYVLP